MIEGEGEMRGITRGGRERKIGRVKVREVEK